MVITKKSAHRQWLLQVIKYWEVARVHYRASAIYFANVLSRGLLVALRVWILTQLYQITFSSTGQAEIGGLTLPMTLWLLMFSQSFQSTTKPILSKLIEEEVRSGTIAYSLGKPYSYLMFHYSAFLGRILPNMLFNIIVGSLTVWWLVGGITFSWTGFWLCLPIIILGFSLDYVISATIGVLAFWFEDIEAFIWIYRKAQLVLGGTLLPLSLFPDHFRTFVEWLPFSQMYYSGARIFVKPEISLFFHYLTVQVIWLIVTLILLHWLFNKASKNISINGG